MIRHIELLIRAASKTKRPDYRESLLDAVAMALPDGEITAQIERWISHRIKQILSESETDVRSWRLTILDALRQIRQLNLRNRKANYPWYDDAFKYAVSWAFDEHVDSGAKNNPLLKKYPRKQALTQWLEQEGWPERLKAELIRELLEDGAVGEDKKSVDSQI